MGWGAFGFVVLACWFDLSDHEGFLFLSFWSVVRLHIIKHRFSIRIFFIDVSSSFCGQVGLGSILQLVHVVRFLLVQWLDTKVSLNGSILQSVFMWFDSTVSPCSLIVQS